jgi:hypothetical protein
MGMCFLKKRAARPAARSDRHTHALCFVVAALARVPKANGSTRDYTAKVTE